MEKVEEQGGSEESGSNGSNRKRSIKTESENKHGNFVNMENLPMTKRHKAFTYRKEITQIT